MNVGFIITVLSTSQMICSVCSAKANLLSTFFSRIYLKLLGIAIVAISKYPDLYMCLLIGFIGIYCFKDGIPLNLIIAIMTATWIIYVEKSLKQVINYWLHFAQKIMTWSSSRHKGIIVDKVEISGDITKVVEGDANHYW